MRILAFNQDWFANEWREAGHEVLTCGMGPDFDIVLESPLIHIDVIIENSPNGFKPDVIVHFDNSFPIIVTGLDESDIPSVFYSVDTHHHSAEHRHAALMFDEVLVAQKDYLQEFIDVGNEPHWMPLWASRYIEPSLEKKYKCVFVGNMNAKLNPDRVKFFEELKKKVDIQCQMGCYWEIFPYSEIVVNQTVKGDLNFRVFEAMMSGAMLLTEATGNGLSELFVDGKHLYAYRKNDVEGAAELIRSCLSDVNLCRRVGLAGREEVLRAHTSLIRGAQMLSIVQGARKSKRKKAKFFGSMIQLLLIAKRFQSINAAASARAVIAALKAAQYAVNMGEPVSVEVANHAIIACYIYDLVIGSNAGTNFLNVLSEAYPREPLFSLAVIRKCLNSGRLNDAYDMARKFDCEDTQQVYTLAESVVCVLLEEMLNKN